MWPNETDKNLYFFPSCLNMVSKLGSQKHTKMLYLSTPGLVFFASFCSKTKATPTHQLNKPIKKTKPNKLKLTQI